MAIRANQQLRDDMRDYRYKASAGETENVLRLAQPAAADTGTTALDLVQQAAEIFTGLENRARETEARAKSLCDSFAEKLQRAEKQKEASERAHRDAVNELNRKLEDASRALQLAHSRIVTAEDQAVAAEFRTQATEARLHRANREIAAVEEAIRKRLL